jgi:uncharacterized membrane protein YdbT with pleckstrin-like domain
LLLEQQGNSRSVECKLHPISTVDKQTRSVNRMLTLTSIQVNTSV